MARKRSTWILLVLLAVGLIFLAKLPAPVLGPAVSAAQETHHRVGPPEIYSDTNTKGATNPDITQANINQNICNPNWSTKSIRPVPAYTTPLKRQQMKALGHTVSNPLPKGSRTTNCVPKSANPNCYEKDHLISLELGGNPKDPHNLWPEPYNTKVDGKVIGAKQKDTVENALHKEVCSSEITLERAQQIIVEDWYSCYLALQEGKVCPMKACQNVRGRASISST